MYIEKKVKEDAKLKKEFVKEEVIKIVESSEDKFLLLIPLLKLSGKAPIAGAVSGVAGIGTKAVIDEVTKYVFCVLRQGQKVEYIFLKCKKYIIYNIMSAHISREEDDYVEYTTLLLGLK